MQNQQPTQCPYCESPLVEKSGTSRKTGNPYYFWGCASYPQCQYTWRPEGNPAPKNRTTGQTERQNSDLIMGRLNTIEKLLQAQEGIIQTQFEVLNKRISDMAKFFIEKEK